jgi:hypothetical protein
MLALSVIGQSHNPEGRNLYALFPATNDILASFLDKVDERDNPYRSGTPADMAQLGDHS